MDETMACNAYEWNKQNPNGLLIGLVGADHVKFQNGIPARYRRLVRSSSSTTMTTDTTMTMSSSSSSSPSYDCTSVLLNPTLIDTRPYGTVDNDPSSYTAKTPERLTLQLRYLKKGIDPSNIQEQSLPSSTGGVLALADLQQRQRQRRQH